MPDEVTYVFEFFEYPDSPTLAFRSTFPHPDDHAAVTSGALLLESQQTLPHPARAVVIGRRAPGGAMKPLGRSVWEGEPRWTSW